MNAFEWVDARDVEHAARLIGETTKDKRVAAKAGGLDLLDLMKEGVIAPSRLVNLKTIAGLDRIDVANSGTYLGALVTLDAIDHHAELRKHYVALADAAGHAATPQVRNVATIGGNLLQKPRCWYLRSRHFHEIDGSIADRARDGRNEFHAIFDNEKVPFVHASTPATALMAYEAMIHFVRADGGTRAAKIDGFLLPPDASRPHDAAIRDDEILQSISLPKLPAGTRAAYHKQTERDSYDWPICDVAVVLTMDGENVKTARIVAGWVAPTPRPLLAAERVLVGKPINEATAREAAAAAVKSATPLSKNAYKVPILETVIRRTLLAAIA